MAKTFIPIFDDEQKARFWRRIDRKGPDECWLWTGSKVDKYGTYRHGMTPLMATQAVLALSGRHKPFSDAQVRHMCHVPLCCNPGHLEWGTALQNKDDAVEHGTQKRLLSPAQVRWLRDQKARTDQTYSVLATIVGVEPACAWSAINRKTYAWVE